MFSQVFVCPQGGGGSTCPGFVRGKVEGGRVTSCPGPAQGEGGTLTK